MNENTVGCGLVLLFVVIVCVVLYLITTARGYTDTEWDLTKPDGRDCIRVSYKPSQWACKPEEEETEESGFYVDGDQGTGRDPVLVVRG